MRLSKVRNHVNPLSVIHSVTFPGFRKIAPVFIDIGAYYGEFTEELSNKFKDSNFIVCEIRTPFARHLTDKFKDKKNIVVLDWDAWKNFWNIIKDSTKNWSIIDTVFINFPDPWFKEKHKKRRLISLNFLKKVKELNLSIKFIFQTDAKILFDDTLEVLRVFWLKDKDLEFFDTSVYWIQTRWERTQLEKWEEIYRVKFKI